MKCAACGYEHSDDGRWIDKVTYYKSGKNKGQVKSVEKEWLRLSFGDAPFRELTFEKGMDSLEYSDGIYTRTVYLYACPECGTVQIDV